MKYYEEIVEAKEAIAKAMETAIEVDGGESELSLAELICIDEYRAEALDLLVRWIHTAQSMKLRIAAYTVLVLGSFSEDNLCFNMPATCDCCSEYRYIRSRLKHHKPLELYMYAFGGEGTFGVRIA